VLLLGGLPIRAPIAHYGPCVMTTREEILQAIDDYETGRLGISCGPNRTEELRVTMTCTQLDEVHDVTPRSNGCEDCLRVGGQWVHLRMCMSCGHVGCCDQSPNRQATAHFHSEQHPLIQSYEPAEDWWYCYLDDVAFMLEGAPTFAHA
jgi:Pirin C-terminal cupin domain/Zn-finger in ubiquitin-hydrolases and other protein